MCNISSVFKLLLLIAAAEKVSANLTLIVKKTESGLEDDQVEFTDEKPIPDAFGNNGEFWQAKYRDVDVAIKKVKGNTPAEVNANEAILIKEWFGYVGIKALVAIGYTGVTAAEEAGIPRVYYLGRIDGELALVMQLLGMDLFTFATKYQPTNLELMRISTQVGNAIRYIHFMGYLHGDIKPENFIFAYVETYDKYGFRNTKLYLGDMGFILKVEAWYSIPRAPCGTLAYYGLNVHRMVEEMVLYVSPPAMPRKEDDNESSTFTIYFVKYGTLPWAALLDEYERLEKLTEAQMRSFSMTNEQRLARMAWCVDKIWKGKLSFIGNIRREFAINEDANKLSMAGDGLVYTLRYARGIRQKNVTEETLGKFWEDGYNKHYARAVQRRQDNNPKIFKERVYDNITVPTQPPTLADSSALTTSTDATNNFEKIDIDEINKQAEAAATAAAALRAPPTVSSEEAKEMHHLTESEPLLKKPKRRSCFCFWFTKET